MAATCARRMTSHRMCGLQCNWTGAAPSRGPHRLDSPVESGDCLVAFGAASLAADLPCPPRSRGFYLADPRQTLHERGLPAVFVGALSLPRCGLDAVLYAPAWRAEPRSRSMQGNDCSARQTRHAPPAPVWLIAASSICCAWQAHERVYRSRQLQQYVAKESEVKRLRAHVRAHPGDADARKAIVRLKTSLFQVHHTTRSIACPCIPRSSTRAQRFALLCVQYESAMRELEAARRIEPERADLLCMCAPRRLGYGGQGPHTSCSFELGVGPAVCPWQHTAPAGSHRRGRRRYAELVDSLCQWDEAEALLASARAVVLP